MDDSPLPIAAHVGAILISIIGGVLAFYEAAIDKPLMTW
jgi:hypothetical protein